MTCPKIATPTIAGNVSTAVAVTDITTEGDEVRFDVGRRGEQDEGGVQDKIDRELHSSALAIDSNFLCRLEDQLGIQERKALSYIPYALGNICMVRSLFFLKMHC